LALIEPDEYSASNSMVTVPTVGVGVRVCVGVCVGEAVLVGV